MMYLRRERKQFRMQKKKTKYSYGSICTLYHQDIQDLEFSSIKCRGLLKSFHVGGVLSFSDIIFLNYFLLIQHLLFHFKFGVFFPSRFFLLLFFFIATVGLHQCLFKSSFCCFIRFTMIVQFVGSYFLFRLDVWWKYFS